MKTKLFPILGCVLISMIFSSQIFACSFNDFIQFEFEPKEFVFLGIVVGYTEKFESTFENHGRLIKFEAVGLRVEVKESIHLPVQADYIEVFRTFPRDTTCAQRGIGLDELKTEFPIGSKVRVIGRENVELFGPNESTVPKIEVSAGTQGQLLNNLSKTGKELSSAESIFDYRSPFPQIKSDLPENEASLWLFELRKDLKRLSEATAESEKVAILKRLAYAYDNYEDYPKLLDKYLPNKKLAMELINLKMDWEKQRNKLNK